MRPGIETLTKLSEIDYNNCVLMEKQKTRKHLKIIKKDDLKRTKETILKLKRSHRKQKYSQQVKEQIRGSSRANYST